MRGYLLALFLMLSTIISAQKKAEPLVTSKPVDSKFQFVSNKDLLPVDEQLWDEVDPFVNGFSRVLTDGKFSFVNVNGKLITEAVFENARNFLDGLAAVQKDGKWGFIDETGKIAIAFRFDIVFDFENTVSVAFENKKWMLIDLKGNVIMPLDIDVCYGFKNGTAKILKDGRTGMMDVNGKINFINTETNIKKPYPYRPNPNQNSLVAQCPDNIDFEFGNFTNWQCYTGSVAAVGTNNVITVNPSPPVNNRHTIVPRVIPSAVDAFGLFPTNPPDGSNFAVRLGNPINGKQAERIRYTIHVPLNDSNFSIVYDYAVVLQDPGHLNWEQPRFISRLLDSATNTYINCASFEYISTSGIPGFQVSTVDPSVIFKPWASVFYSLRGRGGQTLYLEFTTADCTKGAHWGYAYLDVESTCGKLPHVDYDCTFPNITTLTGPPGFQFYNWWDSGFTTIIGTGQSITLNPGPAINTVFWLEVVPFSNFGCLDTLKVTISGTLDAHFDVSDTSTCGAPKTLTFYNRNIPSLTVLWDFGDGNTATGDTVTHTFLSPGTYHVQMNATVPGGCNGVADYNVVIHPFPNVVQPANQILCKGTNTAAVNFTGTVTGTTYSWTNNNTSIGLGASGNGNIPAFTALNTGTTPVTATITVTPSTPGCPGTSKSFTITVNPTPNVVQPANQTLCNGATTVAVNFTGTVTGTTYNWTNSNTAIGLAASGNGNIPAFTATNISNGPLTATITVTPSFAGCPGTPKTFTITVQPAPNVFQPPNQSLCNGTMASATIFTGPYSGTVYSWVNNNTLIGLGASGTGNIPAFIATCTANTQYVATITVTPSVGGCPGTPKTFTFFVKPTPDVTQPANRTFCNGVITNSIIFSGSVNSTTYNWTNDNPSIGLAANGSGSIPPFTAVNTGTVPVTANITVTPVASACPGSPKSFTITVNPTPNVVQPSNQVLCNGANTNSITFAGSINNTTYSWVNNNPAIGLAAGGNGNIPVFTAVNTGAVPITATITVTPSAAGCPGIPQAFTITVNPTPNVTQPANQILCNGATASGIAFTGSVVNAVYTWTNNNTAIGLAANGNGNIAAFTATNNGNTPITATITVTASAAGCPGNTRTFTITVNPTPNVIQPQSQTLCSSSTTNAIAFSGSVNNTIYNWVNDNPSVGLAAGGTGNIPAFIAVNAGVAPLTATITVTPSFAGCPGNPETFTITVNPVPNVIQPANQALCSGTNTNAIAFSGSVNNTVYSWTNNNVSIGLAANGTGNIPSFTATNIGNTSVTATITVTPTASGCTGSPKTFTIIVNPVPNVIQPANQTLCRGNTTSAIAFAGSVNNTTYSWTNTEPSIGLAANGTGNIPAFTALNSGSTGITATITVTPSAFGCPGSPEIFTITVNPTPDVAPPSDLNLCNGVSTNAISFTGALTGTAYSWTNNNTSIGLAASGNGNIPSFAAVNTGNTPVTATITVTPTAGSCTGIAAIFKITVNPTPLVRAASNANVCLGKSIQLNATGAADYYWDPADRLSCTNCANPVATPVDNIKYTVKGISSFGCQAFDSVLLTVIRPFQMLISPDDTLCIGQSTNLTASGANSYLWSPPQGLSRTDIANPTARPNTTTLYRVVGYDGHNCFTDTNFVKITVGPTPTVNIGPDLNLSTGTVVTLNPVTQNGPIINWSWAPATGLSCANCPSPILTVADNTYYTVTVTNNFGCIGTDIISIFAFCKSAQVFIPNAFTPDGDGLNDILMVRGKGIFVKSFRIFNRWGELVFEKTNFNPNDIKYGWDGKVRGIPATPDVFVYTAEVICDNGIIYTYKGNTTLLK